MNNIPARRFKKLYEQILLSHILFFMIGWLLTVLLPAVIYWNIDVLFRPSPGQYIGLFASTMAFWGTNFSLKHWLMPFPGGRSAGLVITQVFAIYLTVFFITLFLRVEASRALLLMSAILAMLFFLFELRVSQIYYRSKLAVLPKGFALNLVGLSAVDVRLLSVLDLGGVRYDGVVADFGVLNAKEERFLTSCALQGVPVYNAKQIYESITGRVKIDRMSENSIGALLPSPIFERVKQCVETALVLLVAPFCILIGLVTALLIRLESPGPVIYSQLRIGKGNRPFRIYKFRSMRFDLDAPAQFAGENDPRITRIGRIIRKLRIDELPQFFNVLKGDMSLIGPRPEQPVFVEEFDRKIPFYSYRHVVKPGITGWAQVRHGYAADADTTQTKIEYDFFYIKHCSFRMDFYIVLLTLRTMLTGFGAR